MKSYPSYKDSGMEWIGMIPTDWDCFRLGMLGVFSSSGIDKKSKDDEENVRMVNYTDLIKGKNRNPVLKGDNDYMKVTTPQSKLVEHKLEKGDMVFIPSSETYEDLGYSSLIDFEEDDIVYSYHILRFKNHRPMFHYFKKYFINHHSVLNQFSLKGKGTTRQIIGRNVFRNVRVVLPPLPEQKQIVSFLDTKTQKIDELIEKTEQKIELLKEKRTSLINHCVTKGLNPDVEMKDSGIDWVGEIPNHWGVKLLKFVFNSIREKSETGEEELLSVLIKKGVVRRRDFLGEDSDNLTRSESLVGYIHCSKGNLVNNIMKMGFYCLGISDYDGIVSPGYSVFEMIDNNDYPKYWDYLLKTEIYVSEYRKRSKGIQESRMRLYDDYFLSIHSLYPPKTEQTQIIEHLDEQTQKIDSTIEKETQRTELLKEYRQSLISEVVTGKVDVRDWKE
jgi:type I restriction enzyme, S subunit